MKTCAKAVSRASAALERERYAEALRYIEEAFRLCDSGTWQEFLAGKLAPVTAQLAVRWAAPLAKKLVKTGLSAASVFDELWHALGRVGFNCRSAENAAVAALETAREVGWPGPVWLAAMPLLVKLYKKCGGVPDRVVEILGEEWGAVESFLEEEAARVKVGGEEWYVVVEGNAIYAGRLP